MQRYLRGAKRQNRWFYGADKDKPLYAGRQGRVYEVKDGRRVEFSKPDGVRSRELDRDYSAQNA